METLVPGVIIQTLHESMRCMHPRALVPQRGDTPPSSMSSHPSPATRYGRKRHLHYVASVKLRPPPARCPMQSLSWSDSEWARFRAGLMISNEQPHYAKKALGRGLLRVPYTIDPVACVLERQRGSSTRSIGNPFVEQLRRIKGIAYTQDPAPGPRRSDLLAEDRRG